MTDIESRFRKLHANGGLDLPLPGGGQTPVRHRKLAEIARCDLPLARLAEAHADAVAILVEAGRQPKPGLYGVWASETTGHPVRLVRSRHGLTLEGRKMFCSGAGLVDRALVTVCTPDPALVDLDLRHFAASLEINQTDWKTAAFAETQTATVSFRATPVDFDAVIGAENWYLDRPGFWHGACGPAACWAGGAMGLVDYALSRDRTDCHTMAHVGGMSADVWGLWAYLEYAGNEIDNGPSDGFTAKRRALSMRHLIEQGCSDVLSRIGRAYGPRVLAYDEAVSRRYQELELYIRQCHAERDLEVLGCLSREAVA